MKLIDKYEIAVTLDCKNTQEYIKFNTAGLTGLLYCYDDINLIKRLINQELDKYIHMSLGD